MNAMFAPAVTMTRRPRATSIPFSRPTLAAMRSISAGSPASAWYSCVAGSSMAARAASSAALGGP